MTLFFALRTMGGMIKKPAALLEADSLTTSLDGYFQAKSLVHVLQNDVF